ncbi:MAG: hypothetical protein II567_15645 [Candidatus Riflebacteria bacterium]|nr:hypothetical protein [Candidatus Riflebacteria bacterium]
MKKIIFIILLLTFCITSNIFAEENKEENASDTQKITQNATNSDSAHNDLKEIKESREEFKKLVDAYHKNPTEENLAALRKQITTNYDKGIERKKAKIVELNNKIEKLKKDIEELTKDRENNISKKVNRFTKSKEKKDKKDRKDRKNRKDRKDKKDKNDKKEVKEKKQSLKNETKEISNEKEKDVLKKDK